MVALIMISSCLIRVCGPWLLDLLIKVHIVFAAAGDCSRFSEIAECLNASSGLCGWSNSSNSCASVQLASGSDLILQCSENGMLPTMAFPTTVHFLWPSIFSFSPSPLPFSHSLCEFSRAILSCRRMCRPLLVSTV